MTIITRNRARALVMTRLAEGECFCLVIPAAPEREGVPSVLGIHLASLPGKLVSALVRLTTCTK